MQLLWVSLFKGFQKKLNRNSHCHVATVAIFFCPLRYAMKYVHIFLVYPPSALEHFFSRNFVLWFFRFHGQHINYLGKKNNINSEYLSNYRSLQDVIQLATLTFIKKQTKLLTNIITVDDFSLSVYDNSLSC